MLNRYIDIYCERLEPGLWAEPLNAVTNAAFIIAAIAALHLAKNKSALNWKSGLLIALLFAIGIGSTLFHTFAQVWAMLSDTLPILIYQIAFLTLYSLNIMQKGWRLTAALLAGFFMTMATFMQMPREWLNGSLEYAPAFIFLFGLGLWHLKNAEKERFALLTASLIFVVSLAFRSIDMAVCENFPIGTHFLWHCLNAVLLYLTARSYILNSRKASNLI